MIRVDEWTDFEAHDLAELALSTAVLVAVSPGERLRAFFNALLVTPIRYALMAWDVVTIGRFATDLWITGNRKWRK